MEINSGLIVILIIALIAIVITYLIARLTKRRIIKYIPSILVILFAIYLLVSANVSQAGFDALIKGIWGVLLFYGAVIGLITAGVLDFINRKKS
ncbi:hypothetical protein [Desulfuribacillus alkaliarsenatis]|uniref:YesK-like protein n=1 Tax=Desulfuribacillus alkaliarsenatis TaxID=766136 RepID=A0A1E5FYN7_9FIRM|nr:hypothetical protein [Desulfuribacillus alkaliarsenatis]OEF95680.1 hypothetical protein BHF68_11275 [Desulfuribacillus alkaliarsenatis]